MILAQNHQRQLSGNKLLVLAIAFLFSFFTYTQENYEIQVKNGVRNYVFVVQQGNTLYGILTKFEIKNQKKGKKKKKNQKGLCGNGDFFFANNRALSRISQSIL